MEQLLQIDGWLRNIRYSTCGLEVTHFFPIYCTGRSRYSASCSDMAQVVPSMAQEVADTEQVVAGMAQVVQYIGTSGYRNGNVVPGIAHEVPDMAQVVANTEKFSSTEV
jgi:hypothetical protein